MNKVIISGRLIKDPDLTFTKGKGTAVCKITLAVDKFTDGKKEADFIGITIFGKQAESTANYMTKGSKMAIVGKIQTGSYEKDGKKHFTVDVIATEVEFLDSKGGNKDKNKPPADMFGATPDDSDSDIPF